MDVERTGTECLIQFTVSKRGKFDGKNVNIFSDFARSEYVNARGIDSALVLMASALTFSFRTAAMNNDELITD